MISYGGILSNVWATHMRKLLEILKKKNGIQVFSHWNIQFVTCGKLPALHLFMEFGPGLSE